MSNTEETQLQDRADRLRLVREHHDMSQREFARALGVNLRTYQSYERAERKITRDLLGRLSKISTVNPRWILEHEEPVYFDEGVEGKSVYRALMPKAIGLPAEELNRYLFIQPFMDKFPAAKSNSDVRSYLFRVEFVDSLTKGDWDDLRIWVNHGDAMSPEINNGDHVVIDTLTSAIVSDGIYLVGTGDVQFLRRIFRLPTGSLSVMCSNPVYRELDAEFDPGATKVFGRAVWVGKRL